MAESLSTETDLCNLALGHLGESDIAAFTEKSPQAEACRKYYATALSFVLSDHDYKFASTKKVGTPLTLPSVIPEITTADLDGWSYLYAYPADCAKMREILTAGQFQNTDPFGFGNPVGAAYGPGDVSSGFHIAPSNSYTVSNERGFGDQRGPEIPFNVAAIGESKYVFTDVADARFRYTRFMDNVIGYPADFSLVFSFYLASLMAFQLTRKFEVQQNMFKVYSTMKPQVQANNMNETPQINREPPAAWVRARGGY